MQTVIIYDSRFGNTEKVAQAIAGGASVRSAVRILNISDAHGTSQALGGRPDLVILGGPTHNHGPSAGLKAFVAGLPVSPAGVRLATFDTRYRGPALVMGSAASTIARSLAKAGANLVASPESFFIVRKGSMETQGLESGELERARQWAAAVVAAVAPDVAPDARALAG